MASAQSLGPKKACKVLSPERTYRALVAEAIENSSAKALDLHALYDEILGLCPHLQNEEQVDWRNSIRHCLSINDEFVRVTKNIFRSRATGARGKDEPRSYWTTANCLHRYGWQKFVHASSANMRKMERLQLDAVEIEDWKPLQPTMKKRKPDNDYAKLTPLALPAPKRPILLPTLCPKGLSTAPLLESPSAYISIVDAGSLSTASPMALDVATQSAMYNIALIDQEDRQLRLQERLRSIDPVLATLLGPEKMHELISQSDPRIEPAKLPSPLKLSATSIDFKDIPSNQQSPNLSVSLPPIFNHSL